MLAGLTGGGAMLAGAMLLALRGRRKAQFRARRPGRTIAAPEPLLAPVEKTLTAVGDPASVDVQVMDEALRRLAAATAASTAPMPELAAVELAHRALTLHLSTPTTLEPPWVGSADQLHWTLPAGADLRDVGPLTPDQPAPYPLLVTIGAGDDGSVWLLNIEDLDLSITGDATFGRDFARYLAAEIACNPWSHGVRVDLVGVAHEVAAMNTDRIHVHTAGEGDPAAEALADAITMIDRSAEADADIATARARQDGADAWPARLLLVDAAEQTEASPGEAAGVGCQQPWSSCSRPSTGTPVRPAPAWSSAASGWAPRAWSCASPSNGRISLPHAGLDLVAVGLTSDEARGCAALLAQSEDLVDAPMPVDQHARDGWRVWSDEAGALREEHTIARHDRADDDGAVSLLEHDDEDYLRQGATTRDDLETLAPKVPQRVRDAVTDADPTLDDDLAMWWSQDCPLPQADPARTRRRPDPRHPGDQAQAVLHRDARLPGHPSTRGDPGRTGRRLQHHPGQGPRLRPHRPRLARHEPANRRGPPARRTQGASGDRQRCRRVPGSRPARRRGPVPQAPRPGRVARTGRRRGPPHRRFDWSRAGPSIGSATADGPSCPRGTASTST